MTDHDPAARKARNARPSARASEPAGSRKSTPSRPTGSRAKEAPLPVGARRERYLVAPLPPSLIPQSAGPQIAGSQIAGSLGGLIGFAVAPQPVPLDPQRFLASLHADPDVSVTRVLNRAPHGTGLDTFGADPTGGRGSSVDFPQIVVVEMDSDRAATFAAEPTVHIEPDRPLRYGADGAGVRVADPGLVPFGTDVKVDFLVRGSGGEPVAGAEIYLMSPTFPARGVTGRDGKATLDTSDSAVEDVSAIYVKPAGDYWTAWLTKPRLSTSQPNLFTCRPLAETFHGFPDKELEGWGWRAMRFDALPPTFRGHGVKVAIIDSGAALTHPDLAGRVTAGRDIPGQNDTGWKVDTVGHGTHCAGIIGGAGNGSGILGIVPEAELHSCKIFPGGRFSDLIEALDYCIAHEIDVVNLSLGTPDPSELVRLKVEQARQAGVACVVAAGNTANAVCFPASMTSVLAVAAIGKLNEYPPDSYHATQTSGIPTAEGYFSAKFTCFGPEIDVCAPGVAIVSSVPPDLYAAEDGTSFAGPHVTGLAALVLAHHPDFRQQFAQRGPQRVDRLFDIIRASAHPMSFGDPGRSGAGLPDAVAALGAAVQSPAPGAPAMPGLPTNPQGVFDGLLPAELSSLIAYLTPPGGQPAAGYPYPMPTYGYPPQSPPAAQWMSPGWAPQWTPPMGYPAMQPMSAGPPPAPAGAGPMPTASTGNRRAYPEVPEPPDPMEPLRAAMRAAGLLPPAPLPSSHRARHS